MENDIEISLKNYITYLERSRPDILKHPRFLYYVQDLETYLRMPGIEKRIGFWPCLDESTAETKIDKYYFYQDTWAAGKVFAINPGTLVDVGSTALLVGIMAKRYKTISIDIRPLPVSLPNLESRKGSITDLPFEDGTVETLSSLCVIEHIGLGRYGDPLDTQGSLNAFREIRRVIRQEGHLLISVPLSHTPGLLFNAHRIFCRNDVLNNLEGFSLMDELYLFPEPGGCENVSRLTEMQYCVWCGHFTKSAAT